MFASGQSLERSLGSDMPRKMGIMEDVGTAIVESPTKSRGQPSKNLNVSNLTVRRFVKHSGRPHKYDNIGSCFQQQPRPTGTREARNV
uniref:Uncharacterized protein n=1 Tax=Lepeophtheirus salmonis TaxID=72036 RepID=A0A0K2USW1_LEPSM